MFGGCPSARLSLVNSYCACHDIYVFRGRILMKLGIHLLVGIAEKVFTVGCG